MNWNEMHNVHTVEDMIEHFSDRIECEPEELKKEIEGELETMYVRMGNDIEGRGVVGENSLISTISSLEAVRALCLKKIRATES